MGVLRVLKTIANMLGRLLDNEVTILALQVVGHRRWSDIRMLLLLLCK